MTEVNTLIITYMIYLMNIITKYISIDIPFTVSQEKYLLLKYYVLGNQFFKNDFIYI